MTLCTIDMIRKGRCQLSLMAFDQRMIQSASGLKNYFRMDICRNVCFPGFTDPMSCKSENAKLESLVGVITQCNSSLLQIENPAQMAK